MQPQPGVKDCVAMMITILAEPGWITVPCNQKIPTILICQKVIKKEKLHYTENNPFLNIKNIQSCGYLELYIRNRCIIFEKHSIHTNLSDLNYEIQNRVSLHMMALQGKYMKKSNNIFHLHSKILHPANTVYNINSSYQIISCLHTISNSLF